VEQFEEDCVGGITPERAAESDDFTGGARCKRGSQVAKR